MLRRTKFISLTFVVLFLLACSTVTQPFKDVQNLAGTAQSFATAMPVDTLRAIASEIPPSTLQALPSQIPNMEGIVDPKGTPVAEWKGIPIMPQATAGEESQDANTYSFKVNATIKEVQDYYSTELKKLDWSSTFNTPDNDAFAMQMYQKDNSFLTVTITNVNGSVLVVLTTA